MISNLIDKQDNFEIIRDEIAAILATESANQQVLAEADGQDPDDWKLNVYIERTNPWSQWQNSNSDRSPIVNVWFDSESFDQRASNVTQRQKTTGIFHIDCIGYGKSSSSDDGHTPGDKAAALEAQRAVRLARNILMSSEYTYLGLQGTVWKRWPRSINLFQPNSSDAAMQKIVGARLSLSVDFNEFSPQDDYVTLELLSLSISRAEDGMLIAEADYDYTEEDT